MIDFIFYIGTGLWLYTWNQRDSFDFGRPLFWAIVFGWPAFLVFTLLQTIVEALEEERKKK